MKIYCPFSLGLGLLGIGLYGVLGVLSIRFRNRLRGKTDSQEKYLVKSEASNDNKSAIEGAAAETRSVATVVASNADEEGI